MIDAAAVERLRRNLGDVGSGAFRDDELAQLLEEQAGDERRALRQGLWEMLAQGARWNDYTDGLADEKKSQIFKQLRELYGLVNAEIAEAAAATGPGVGTAATSGAVRVEVVWP